MQNLRLPLACFGLGIVTDLLVVLYYKAVQASSIPAAMFLSVMVTLTPLVIASLGVERKKKSLYLWFAIGSSVGTAVALMMAR